MPEFINGVSVALAFQSSEETEVRRAPSATVRSDDFESLSIPNRGIVVAALVSAFLWAGIILGCRELWLLLR
jgi:hypothetical protein